MNEYESVFQCSIIRHVQYDASTMCQLKTSVVILFYT